MLIAKNTVVRIGLKAKLPIQVPNMAGHQAKTQPIGIGNLVYENRSCQDKTLTSAIGISLGYCLDIFSFSHTSLLLLY